MTQKGFVVLREFVSEFGSDSVAHVISAEDKQIDEDYYLSIEQFCTKNAITFYNRKCIPQTKKNLSLRFAIGWRWLIPDPQNLIVLHDSLLPKYRGFAPVVSALINGDKRIGVTALFANKDYDEGDIISQKQIDITYPVKISYVINCLASLYSELVKEVYLDTINKKPIQRIKQERTEGTYSLWRDEEDYFINWNNSAERLKRTIDALGFPYLGARTYMNGEIVIIKEAEIIEDIIVENREEAIGKVVKVTDGMPSVICRNGILKLTELIYTKSGGDVLPLKKFRTRFE